ncbi:hypothetical protein [Streptomyces sp. T028]|uniref:hypothetical protein n=1 Tax=Streptomyces sp. T028 TaxID=3394379 RepID=UPI003A83888A
MADKQDRWLDRETAERLLRGESSENAVAPEAREQAERLARTLAALSSLGAEPLRADEELPGEAAALKAFSEARAARESREFHASQQSHTSHQHATDLAGAADAGLVRIGGRTGRDRNGEQAHGRRHRPLRLALAATLAVGMLGGVAVAAGTGALPSPFDAEPEPGASVSSAASPDRPLISPSPDASGGGPDAVGPDGGTDPDTTGGAGGTEGSSATPGAQGDWPKGVTSSCRDIKAGRTLDTQHRRTLEDLAGGWSHVTSYCVNVLEGVSRRDTGSDDRDDSDDQYSWGDGDGGTGQNGADGGSAGLSSGQDAGTGHDQDENSGGTGSNDDGGTQGGYGAGGGDGGAQGGGTGRR